MKAERTRFLIIGAGPFGLAMAAAAGDLGIPHVVVGEPMSFWRRHMPAGMLLRSACDWHFDPAGSATLVRFLETRGQSPSDVEPLSLELYLRYADWFAETRGREFVNSLDVDLPNYGGETGPPPADES